MCDPSLWDVQGGTRGSNNDTETGEPVVLFVDDDIAELVAVGLEADQPSSDRTPRQRVVRVLFRR